jgi:hypothetical protein
LELEPIRGGGEAEDAVEGGGGVLAGTECQAGIAERPAR